MLPNHRHKRALLSNGFVFPVPACIDKKTPLDYFAMIQEPLRKSHQRESCCFQAGSPA
jgi:hypothetical protein